MGAQVSGLAFLGELSLDDTHRHLQGMQLMVGLGCDRGKRTTYTPAAAEATLVEVVR